jgi:hypothetical protein
MDENVEDELYFDRARAETPYSKWDKTEKDKLSNIINKIRESLKKARVLECDATIVGDVGVIKVSIEIHIKIDE